VQYTDNEIQLVALLPSAMLLGSWVGIAFAYGGALGSFLSHRDRYLVTLVHEDLVKAPKELAATIFEKLGLVT